MLHEQAGRDLLAVALALAVAVAVAKPDVVPPYDEALAVAVAAGQPMSASCYALGWATQDAAMTHGNSARA